MSSFALQARSTLLPSVARRLFLAWMIGGATFGAQGLAAAPQTVVVLDAQGKPKARAVVAILVKGVKATAPAGTSTDMGQKNKRFVPDLVAIQTGTGVNFPNFDTVRHHVYSFSATKKFEIKLYAGTPGAPVVFDRPGTATLGCNIHDAMVGHVHVVDTPYFAITNDRGEAVIDVPSGEHLLQGWHPGMGESTPPVQQPIRTGSPQSLRLPG